MSLSIYLLFLYAFSGMLFDIKTDRIPNMLIAAEIATGFLYQVLSLGTLGLPAFLAGLVVPFMVTYPLFLFRMLGAGDCKLLMALGSVAGFPLNAQIMLWSLLCGAVMAICIMLRRTGFRTRFAYLAGYLKEYLRTGTRRPYRRKGKQPENFCFTPAILAGVVICILIYR